MADSNNSNNAKVITRIERLVNDVREAVATGIEQTQDDLVKLVTKGIEETFDKEGARGRGRWRKLKVKSAKDAENNRKILQQSGQLKRYLSNPANAKTEVVDTGNGKRLQISFSGDPLASLAIIHHRGAPKKKIPARPILKLNAQDRKDIKKIVLTQVKGNLRAALGKK